MDGGYLLDFLVITSTFDPELELPQDPVYIIFQVDGSQEPVATYQKTAQKEILWNFSARVILQLKNLSSACLYATMCTFSEADQNSIPIGTAKIKLRSFPISRPANISFHIFNPNNSAMKVGTINLKANINTMLTQQYAMAIPINR